MIGKNAGERVGVPGASRNCAHADAARGFAPSKRNRGDDPEKGETSGTGAVKRRPRLLLAAQKHGQYEHVVSFGSSVSRPHQFEMPHALLEDCEQSLCEVSTDCQLLPEVPMDAAVVPLCKSELDGFVWGFFFLMRKLQFHTLFSLLKVNKLEK